MQTLYNQSLSLYMQFLVSQGLPTKSGPLQQPLLAQYLRQTNNPPAQLEHQKNSSPGWLVVVRVTQLPHLTQLWS